jgi:hypothetical protein
MTHCFCDRLLVAEAATTAARAEKPAADAG